MAQSLDDATRALAKPVETHGHRHASHPAVIRRLNRAGGHLAAVVAMIEDGRPCVDIAQQLHAVERAIAKARRLLVEDHIDHCLKGAAEASGASSKADLSEFKAITRYL